MLFTKNFICLLFKKKAATLAGIFYLYNVLPAKPRFSYTPKQAELAIIHVIYIGKSFGVFEEKSTCGNQIQLLIMDQERLGAVNVMEEKDRNNRCGIVSDSLYHQQTRILFMKLIHLGLTIASFSIAWMFYQFPSVPLEYVVFRREMLVTAAYGGMVFFFNRTYNAYRLGYLSVGGLVLSQLLSQVFSFGILYILFVIWRGQIAFPVAFPLLLLFQVCLDFVWSWTGNQLYFRWNPPKRTVLIYRNLDDKKRLVPLSEQQGTRLFRVTGEIMYDGGFDDLRNQLDPFEVVFVAGVNSRLRNGILKYCKERNISCFLIPHVGDVIMQEAEHIPAFYTPVFRISRTTPKLEYLVCKRIFDVCAALFGIVITSPIMLVTALAIRLYDGGDALYRQVRLTKGGREFEILKFRSMRMDAEKDGVARLSTGEKDDRITPIGKIIRKCRLDELPQFFNILRGDMSFVGPRPERPEIAEQYYKKLPAFQLRLQVKAGLTGYAQDYGRYNTSPYEKLEFDLFYLSRMSMVTDLQLIFATFAILFMSESTKGVQGGTVNTIADRVEERAE